MKGIYTLKFKTPKSTLVQTHAMQKKANKAQKFCCCDIKQKSAGVDIFSSSSSSSSILWHTSINISIGISLSHIHIQQSSTISVILVRVVVVVVITRIITIMWLTDSLCFALFEYRIDIYCKRDREWERGRRRRDIQQLLIAFIVCFIIRAILERSLHILFFIVFSWYPSSSLSSSSTSSSSSSS